MLKNQKIKVPLLLEDLGMSYPKETSKQKKRYGIYKCHCGRDFKSMTADVNSGNTTSCGCSSSEMCILSNTTHGKRAHVLYATWHSMVRRTSNIKDRNFKHYGARGIKVCERWKDINNFIEDMYPSYQEGLTIDRINNDGNYELSNCRWATQYMQCRNTQRIMSTNKSGYRGVCFDNRRQNWKAEITVNYKNKYLGCFNNPIDAAKAYDKYVIDNNLEHTKNF